MTFLRRSLIVIALLCCPVIALAAKNKSSKTAASASAGQSAADRLRAEWDMGYYRMMKLVADDANFDPALKQSLGDAADKFVQQQEDLLAQVAKDPKAEADVQKQRAALLAAFTAKMKDVNNNPAMQKEIARRMKAMNKEIDTLATSADAIMATLDQIGATKEQKDKIRPALKDASTKVKKTVDDSDTKSIADKKVRDAAVSHIKDAHRKIHDTLTPAQREKLLKKLADEP
jgi:hypothetical protein